MKLIFYILFCLLIPFTGMTQHEVIRAEINKLIKYDTEIEWDKTPGFVVSIIDGDSTFYFGFGSISKEESRKPNKTDIFEIGSISKTFTANLIHILEAEKILSTTSKLNDLLPEPFRNPRLDHLTLNDLITHNSGLPRRPAFFGRKEKDPQNPYAFYSKEDLLTFYSTFVPIHPEGTYTYSHTNYAILEFIIEQSTGLSFEGAIEKYLFQPLNMDSSFVKLPEQRELLITPGYDRAQRETKLWEFKSFAGSEGVKTSAAELSTYVRACMGQSGFPLDTLLPLSNEIQSATDINKQIMMSRAWQVYLNKNHYNILTHSGFTSGHRAFVGFIPETKTGVIILSNSTIGTGDLGFQILRMINYNWERKH